MMIGARYWIYCQRPRLSILMSPHDGRGWNPQEIQSDGYPWIKISMKSHNGIYAAKSMEHIEQSVMTEKAKEWLRRTWWQSLNKEYGPRAIVFGRVQIWGTVIEHARGYRAEQAKIHSLDKITLGPEFASLCNCGSDLEILRLMYGVSS